MYSYIITVYRLYGGFWAHDVEWSHEFIQIHTSEYKWHFDFVVWFGCCSPRVTQNVDVVCPSCRRPWLQCDLRRRAVDVWPGVKNAESCKRGVQDSKIFANIFCNLQCVAMYMLQNIHVIEVRYNTHIIYRYGVRAALVLHPQHLCTSWCLIYIYIDIYLYSIHPVVIIHNPRLDVRMQAHSCCIVYSECLRYFCENCHTIYSFGLWHKMRARWNDIVSGPSPAPQKRIYIMSLFKFTCFICLMTARLSMEFGNFHPKKRLEIIGAFTACLAVLAGCCL